MGGICVEIDMERLDAVIGEFQIQLKTAQGCLNDMIREVEYLNTVWKGKAHGAFRLRIDQGLVYMEAYIKEMLRFAACMEYAGEEYRRSDREIKQFLEELGFREGRSA